MDRVTQALMTEYAESEAISDSTSESKLFEIFVAHTLMVAISDDPADMDDVVVGDGGDLGLDAVIIQLNQEIVVDVERIDAIVRESSVLDVRIRACQAKTTSGFQSSVISTLSTGLRNLFSGDLPGVNEDIIRIDEMIKRLYAADAVPKFRESPLLEVFYVTTGVMDPQDSNMVAAERVAQRDLAATNLFSKVVFSRMGARELQNLYRRQRSGLERSFRWQSKVAFPDISGVEQAFLGLLPVREFLKLITDDDGELQSSVFYDNVRDYQGLNEVNSEIKRTLLSGDLTSAFPTLNNGITIVARGLKSTGDTFTITDYQVVNGCQTSNVIYETMPGVLEADSDAYVPLKVIHTDDDLVAGRITKATNRQTQVRDEDLLALEDKQKEIEQYFESIPDEGRQLFYERRSRQYANATSIEKTRIVNIQTLGKAAGSMFFGEARRANRYSKELMKQRFSEIFGPTLEPVAFYCAASGLYRLEYLFRNRRDALDIKYRHGRYHILSYLKIKHLGDGFLRQGDRHQSRDLEGLLNIFWDSDRCLEEVLQVTRVIDDLISHGGVDYVEFRDAFRTEAFTDELMARARGEST